jgi:hypothetical protein
VLQGAARTEAEEPAELWRHIRYASIRLHRFVLILRPSGCGGDALGLLQVAAEAACDWPAHTHPVRLAGQASPA